MNKYQVPKMDVYEATSFCLFFVLWSSFLNAHAALVSYPACLCGISPTAQSHTSLNMSLSRSCNSARKISPWKTISKRKTTIPWVTPPRLKVYTYQPWGIVCAKS